MSLSTARPIPVRSDAFAPHLRIRPSSSLTGPWQHLADSTQLSDSHDAAEAMVKPLFRHAAAHLDLNVRLSCCRARPRVVILGLFLGLPPVQDVQSSRANVACVDELQQKEKAKASAEGYSKPLDGVDDLIGESDVAINAACAEVLLALGEAEPVDLHTGQEHTRWSA